ncbi:hypothetical protein PR048_032305 [Dryococelus australis]|uniref:Uncharacterized protein n=1 Tax=Dryococelus australis TaxID=614101 RepID=A0ABQ9G319_9NEOP|nr:hypothetical protein PR048_032305 [Dryococelus australis]
MKHGCEEDGQERRGEDGKEEYTRLSTGLRSMRADHPTRSRRCGELRKCLRRTINCLLSLLTPHPTPHPPRRNVFDYLLPDFCMGESCWAMPQVGGFSQRSPTSSSLAFQRFSILALLYPHRFLRPLMLESTQTSPPIHHFLHISNIHHLATKRLQSWIEHLCAPSHGVHAKTVNISVAQLASHAAPFLTREEISAEMLVGAEELVLKSSLLACSANNQTPEALLCCAAKHLAAQHFGGLFSHTCITVAPMRSLRRRHDRRIIIHLQSRLRLRHASPDDSWDVLARISRSPGASTPGPYVSHTVLLAPIAQHSIVVHTAAALVLPTNELIRTNPRSLIISFPLAAPTRKQKCAIRCTVDDDFPNLRLGAPRRRGGEDREMAISDLWPSGVGSN